MKLSEKRTTAIYKGISDPIVILRIELEQNKIIITDSVLFDLEQTIWRNVAKVLDIDPANSSRCNTIRSVLQFARMIFS